MLTDPRDSDIGGAIVLGNSKVEREGYLQYDTSTTYHTTDCLGLLQSARHHVYPRRDNLIVSGYMPSQNGRRPWLTCYHTV